ncbi:MAG: hypothetical protein ACRBN8_01600 [Nannocystales bacterium]
MASACSTPATPTSKSRAADPVIASESRRPAEVVEPLESPPVSVEEPAEPVAPETTVPTKVEALTASKALLKGKLARLAPLVSLPDGRAALVWRNFTRASEAGVELVVVAQSDRGWEVQSHATVAEASTPWLDEGPPPFAVTLRSDDYDDDGEPEILVRVRASVMCPGGGPNTITQMTIFDLAPTLEPAFTTELRHLMDARPEDATTAKVTHEDVDGDGHRDVKVVYRSHSEGEATTATNVWTYTEDQDKWILHKPQYERWGCSW